MAILVALIGMAVGGFLGWRFEDPLCRATASIYLNPVTPSFQGTPDQSLLSLFESFVASQVEVIGTGKVTARAMETEVWRAAGGRNDAEATRSFEERRSVVRLSGTHIVQVAFVDPDPKVALAGVRALIEAYQEQFAELHSGAEVNWNTEGEGKTLVRRLREGMDRLTTLTARFGGVEGLEIRHRAMVRLVMSTEDALRSVPRLSTDDVRAQAAPNASGGLAPSVIAVESEQMKEYLAHLALQEAEEETLSRQPGNAVERLIELRGRIAVLREGIDDLARDWNLEHATQSPPTLRQLETREKGLGGRLEELKEKSRELGRIRGEAMKLEAENEELNYQLLQMEAFERDLANRPAGKGRIQIADPGTLPTAPFTDPRKTNAAIAAAIFGLLGFLIVLLTGMGDRRLKDAVGADDVLSGVRSLGLLPSLPTDPNHANGTQIATHFTHQIRTLLEIAHARDEGVCICVTGPAPGSGKTTLTAALGLSFASTGSRTLLVDADETGRGLAHVVMQMLVDRVRHAGREDEAPPPLAGRRDQTAEAQHHLLDPLVHRGGGGNHTAPGELEGLLTEAIRPLGVRRAREMGLVSDLFSLADLLETDEARDRLALHLMSALASEGELTSGSPAEWIPSRTQAIGFPGAELDADWLEDHLYRTGLETLSFLPLHAKGQERGPSIAMMAGVLARLREQFDVVLVDAGSVPGTDETSLVTVQADSVVLVVSPEDEGPQAEQALAHLEVIRARVAGIVFNRADQKDIVKTGRSMYVSQGERQVG